MLRRCRSQCGRSNDPNGLRSARSDELDHPPILTPLTPRRSPHTIAFRSSRRAHTAGPELTPARTHAHTRTPQPRTRSRWVYFQHVPPVLSVFLTVHYFNKVCPTNKYSNSQQLVSEKDLIVREEACRVGLLFGGFTGSYHALRCFLRRFRKKETPYNAA